MNPSPSLPTGFYRDPLSGSVRRWDGSTWRELPPLVTPPGYSLPAPRGAFGDRDRNVRSPYR